MLNVLLVGGWVDQAFSFVRSFSQQPNVNVFVADCWPKSALRFSKHREAFYLTRHYDDPGYVGALLAVCEWAKIDVLLPMHHEDLVAIAPAQDSFRAIGVELPIPRWPVIHQAIDKYYMASIAKTAGVLVPRTQLVTEGIPPSFPVLVKLKDSTGQRGQRRCDTYEEFTDHVMSSLEKCDEDDLIVQEYIPGYVPDTMYTVGLLYDREHRMRACVTLKKIRSKPFTGGTCVCSVAVRNHAVAEAAVKVVETLGNYVGIADVEIKVGPDGRPIFIELNPRPWGSMWGACVAGVDFPMLWLKVALGENFPCPTYVTGRYTSFLARDLVLLREVVKGLFTANRREAWRTLKTYTRPYFRGRQVTSDFILNDLGPFLMNVRRVW